ncbi:MAG: ribosome-associated translation inhibitor RaiA [Betaproteobacteria bacterium]|nr:ribosome-associated translation inhibitor RaiA [Betaproteobacteria bacterium]
MNLQISGHHIEVTPALRSYVETKLEPVTHHFERVIAITVILSVDKLKQKAEVTVQVPGRNIFVGSTDSDLYAAIDSMCDKLDRKVQQHKQKISDLRRRGARVTEHLAE